MWEKLEMFELRKRSNLIFYGVRGETRETQSDLIHKITTIIRRSLDLKKDVTVSNASRVYSGPKVGSCRFVSPEVFFNFNLLLTLLYVIQSDRLLSHLRSCTLGKKSWLKLHY